MPKVPFAICVPNAFSGIMWCIPIAFSFWTAPGCFRSTIGIIISLVLAMDSRWNVCLCCSNPCWVGYCAVHWLHLNNIKWKIVNIRSKNKSIIWEYAATYLYGNCLRAPFRCVIMCWFNCSWLKNVRSQIWHWKRLVRFTCRLRGISGPVRSTVCIPPALGMVPDWRPRICCITKYKTEPILISVLPSI